MNYGDISLDELKTRITALPDLRIPGPSGPERIEFAVDAIAFARMHPEVDFRGGSKDRQTPSPLI